MTSMTSTSPDVTEAHQGQPVSGPRPESSGTEGTSAPRPNGGDGQLILASHDGDRPLTLASRLLLSAQLLGTEAAAGFEQLYTMPVSVTLLSVLFCSILFCSVLFYTMPVSVILLFIRFCSILNHACERLFTVYSVLFHSKPCL